MVKINRMPCINRLTCTLLISVSILFTPLLCNAKNEGEHRLNIAMLHLELKYADLTHNAALIEAGIKLAADHNADWVMTPELSHTGYRFDLKIGTDWITTGPDEYVKRIQSLAKDNGVTVFLSHLEQIENKNSIDKTTAFNLFNTLFVINSNGNIIGRHKKINTIPVSESWSTAGSNATVVDVDKQKVGLLICADAWPKQHVQSLKDQGADIILSSASWAPGEYGPKDTWEKRSSESSLPIFVNNRTGIERQFDLTKSVSVVSHKGERLMSHDSPNSQLILIEWDTQKNQIVSSKTHEIKL